MDNKKAIDKMVADKKKMSVEKKLDKLLKFHKAIYIQQQLEPDDRFDPYNEEWAEKAAYRLRWGKLKFDICLNPVNKAQSDKEMKLLYDKLISDKYVTVLPDDNYLVTANGMIFIDSGGYQGQINDKKLERFVTISTAIIVALGTLLLGLNEFVKLFPCHDK